MTVAALKRSTLYAIVPWGLQRRQSRERRGGSAVPGTGSSSSDEDTHFFWAPQHSTAASLNLPGGFYQPWYFFKCFFSFLFLTSCLELHTAPSRGCRAAAQGVGAPSPVHRPTVNPSPSSPSPHLEAHLNPKGNGEGRALGGTCPFLHLTWLLPIFLHSIPQQLEVHFHQAVTVTRRRSLSTGGHHTQPTCASPTAGPPTCCHQHTGDSTHIRTATTALLTHLGHTHCHPGKDSCGVGALHKVPALSREPLLHHEGGSGNAQELGQLELSWESPWKVLAPPGMSSLSWHRALGALSHAKPQLLGLFLRTITLGGHLRAANMGTTGSQGESGQGPVATRAFSKPKSAHI